MTAETGPLTFGTLLRYHRLAAGWTQQQLADRANVSRRGIDDLERGIDDLERGIDDLERGIDDLERGIDDLERGIRRTPYPETVRGSPARSACRQTRWRASKPRWPRPTGIQPRPSRIAWARRLMTRYPPTCPPHSPPW